MSYETAAEAIREGNLDALRGALEDMSDEELANARRDAPLTHLVIYQRNIDESLRAKGTPILDALLEAGIDPNSAHCSWEGTLLNETALAMAMYCEDPDAAKLLLEHGADPDIFVIPDRIYSGWEGRYSADPGLLRERVGIDGRDLLDTFCPEPEIEGDLIAGRWVLISQHWAESDFNGQEPFNHGELIFREDGTFSFTHEGGFFDTIEGSWERTPCERPVRDEAWPYDPSVMPRYEDLYNRYKTVETLARFDKEWWPYGTLRLVTGGDGQARICLESWDEEMGGMAYSFYREEVAHPLPRRRV